MSLKLAVLARCLHCYKFIATTIAKTVTHEHIEFSVTFRQNSFLHGLNSDIELKQLCVYVYGLVA